MPGMKSERHRGDRWIHRSGNFHLDDDIFCQSFESLSVWLHHGDRYITGLAGVDVHHDAGFAYMDTADDLALSAVLDFAWSFSFHLYYSVAFRLYPVFNVLPSRAAS